MITLAILLSAATILTADRVQANIVTTDDDPTVEPVVWKRLPSDAEIAHLLPKQKSGSGYAHLSCSSIQPNGQLTGCESEKEGIGYGMPLDADFEKAGLSAIRLFRVDSAFAKQWKNRRYRVDVNIAFVQGGSSRTWGDCYPFCQSGLPRAPVAPAQ